MSRSYRTWFLPLSLLLLCAGSTRAQAPDPKRLIQINPAQQVWMTEEEVLKLGQEIHENHGHCGGFMDVTGRRPKRKLFLSPLSLIEGRRPAFPQAVEPLLREVEAGNLENTVRTLSSYPNRHYRSQHGVRAAHWLRDRFISLGRHRSDTQVELFEHSFQQPSVIARIQGTNRAEESIILGAHLDSIRWPGFGGEEMIAPGADDDASGVAVLLETYRILVQSGFRPERTIEFMAYAGEEAGLLGSQDIAESYQQKSKQVLGVLQLDMTMFPGQDPAIHLVTDFTHADLNRFVGSLIDAYVKVPWREMECGYACSDHASWDELGFPAVFPFEAAEEERNQKIHTAEDRLDLLDHEHGAHFARLALAFAVELGLERQ